MTGSDLAFTGLAGQARMVRDSTASPRELVEAALERIDRVDPDLNAFRRVFRERALAEAEQAGARRTGGGDRPLLGVPVAVKDTVDVAGEITANGTGAHGGPAREDSEVVARLRAAGAILVGKTNLPELAISGFTESATWGVTRNPWAPEHTPGGSSGGSAAAVAGGLVAAAHASDGAGSIRIPAACCGLFGLKPQRGRVSMAPDGEHWHGLSVFGCLTRSVEDSGLFLDAVSEPPPGAESWQSLCAPGARRLKIAVSALPSLAGVPVADEVRGGLDATADLLRSLGHDVRDRDPDLGPGGSAVGRTFLPRYLAGIAEDAAGMAHPERLERRTRGFARMGAPLAPLVVAARKAEEPLRQRLAPLFEEFDVLLTPVVARPPVEVRRWEGMGALRTLLGMGRIYPFTGVWNTTGQPAASVPAGFTPEGLPLAVQVIGRADDEATVLALAAELEAERPWADRRPLLG